MKSQDCFSTCYLNFVIKYIYMNKFDKKMPEGSVIGLIWWKSFRGRGSLTYDNEQMVTTNCWIWHVAQGNQSALHQAFYFIKIF